MTDLQKKILKLVAAELFRVFKSFQPLVLDIFFLLKHRPLLDPCNTLIKARGQRERESVCLLLFLSVVVVVFIVLFFYYCYLYHHEEDKEQKGWWRRG